VLATATTEHIRVSVITKGQHHTLSIGFFFYACYKVFGFVVYTHIRAQIFAGG
jgi:hypothetical protein